MAHLDRLNAEIEETYSAMKDNVESIAKVAYREGADAMLEAVLSSIKLSINLTPNVATKTSLDILSRRVIEVAKGIRYV